VESQKRSDNHPQYRNAQRKGFHDNNITPHNCKQSLAARKTAKVTTLLFFSKCYLRNRATDQCTSMAFAGVNRITNMTHGVNQRRITDLSSQPANEDFDQLRIVLVRMFPNTFAQFGAREDTGRFPHQHL
jgi:hypothetical protein